MNKELFHHFRHPKTGSPLQLLDRDPGDEEGVEGYLSSDGDRFPIIRGIPRFCPIENYAASFGYQWEQFATTQLDSQGNWNEQSQKQFYEETKWPRQMEGQKILEAGSGMGRFTEILAQTGAIISTFDYSSAIDVNYKNNSRYENVSFAQADIYSPPYEIASFDKVLCLGVLQHCPSPKEAFQSLLRFLKPGGKIVVDVYRLKWTKFFIARYYLRPLTRLMSIERLYKFVEFHVGWVYPLTGLVHRVGMPSVARTLSNVLGMVDHRGKYGTTDDVDREQAFLETYDAFSPRFDRPQTLGEVKKWFCDAGLINIDVRPGYNGIEARGEKPGMTKNPVK